MNVLRSGSKGKLDGEGKEVWMFIGNVKARCETADNALEARAETGRDGRDRRPRQRRASTAETGVHGRSEDAHEKTGTDAFDLGQPCTRVGVDVSLRTGEVDGGCCRVGMGDGVVDCPNGHCHCLPVSQRLKKPQVSARGSLLDAPKCA
jgi:hypothetical protein